MRTVHNLAEVASKRKNLRNNLTPQEIMLWTRLKGKALGFKFRRQHSIGTYIVDFFCPSARLIIELDGSQHAEEKAEIYDETRTDYLRKLGYTILRFWNNEINANLESVLIHISDALNEITPNPSVKRTPPPSPPLCRKAGDTPPQLRRG